MTKKSKKNSKKNGMKLVLVLAVVTVGVFFIMNYQDKDDKNFSYAGANWSKGIYDGEDVYYIKLDVQDRENEVFLKNDPRINHLPFEGEMGKLDDKVYVSISKEVENCKMGMDKLKENLRIFLEELLKKEVIFSTTDAKAVLESGKLEDYKTCESTYKKSVVIINIGENKVAQSPHNEKCYTIYLDSCTETLPAERFIIESMLKNRNNQS